MDSLELKLPPLALALAVALLMYGASVLFAHDQILPFGARLVPACILAMVACGVLGAALVAFRGHQTTVNPLSPEEAAAIVQTGIYAYSRNPMYLAMIIALAGWGLALGQLSGLFCLLIFPVCITRLQIVPEERLLEQKFGQAYDHYRNATARWWGPRHL